MALRSTLWTPPGTPISAARWNGSLKMVNGVLLLVDAFEGPMPQTRFVLQKALELNHKVIIVVNKIDRPDARPDDVVDEVLELLLELDATDEQLDSPVVFCSAREGTASLSSSEAGTDLTPLFDTIICHIDPPVRRPGGAASGAGFLHRL